jgi:hypothetical protein
MELTNRIVKPQSVPEGTVFTCEGLCACASFFSSPTLRLLCVYSAKQLLPQHMNYGGARDFSLIHSVQTGSGAHPASDPMGIGGVKLTTHLHLVPRSSMVELGPHSLMSSWRNCIIKYKNNLARIIDLSSHSRKRGGGAILASAPFCTL